MIVGESLNPMNPSHISISPKTIGKLLREQRLKVPPSQREYRWKQEHVQDLYTDIRKALDAEKGPEEYFLGSIVSINSGGTIMIYDGQQRLATIMILIAAIRDGLIKLGNSQDAEVAERNYLFSRLRGGLGETPNLTLNLEDSTFFFNNILPRQKPDKAGKAPKSRLPESHRRMVSASKYAKQFVESLVSNRKPDDADAYLNRWLDYIEQSLHVIWVQVASESVAFTIFETMNDRGLKLSAADLLKNFIHSQAEDRRDEVMHKWSSMVGTLKTVEGEEENVVEYIRCFWVTRHGQTRTRYLYDKIKEKITNRQKALDLLSELESSVQDYAAIIADSHANIRARGDKVRKSINKISALGVTQLRPMLLAAFQKFKPGEFAKLAENSVTWSVRFLVSGSPSGSIEGWYARAAMKIWNGELSSSEDVYDELKKNIPKDDIFIPQFANAEESNPRIARYYLSELQFAEDGKWPDSSMTLEHIMDKEFLGKEHTVTEQEHSENVNKLGNLALIEETDNGRMQDMSYEQKKAIYESKRNPSLTQGITRIAPGKNWVVNDIENRQQKMAQLARKAWPI